MINDFIANIPTLSLYPKTENLLREICACYPEAWVPPCSPDPRYKPKGVSLHPGYAAMKTHIHIIRKAITPATLQSGYAEGYRLVLRQNNQGAGS